VRHCQTAPGGPLDARAFFGRRQLRREGEHVFQVLLGLAQRESREGVVGGGEEEGQRRGGPDRRRCEQGVPSHFYHVVGSVPWCLVKGPGDAGMQAHSAGRGHGLDQGLTDQVVAQRVGAWHPWVIDQQSGQYGDLTAVNHVVLLPVGDACQQRHAGGPSDEGQEDEQRDGRGG